MTTARLRVSLPDHVWIAAVSQESPETMFRVLAAIPGNGNGFAVIQIHANDLAPILEQMRNHPQVTSVAVLQKQPAEATVQIETTHPLVLFSARDSGVSLLFPIDLANGIATVDVTATRERLSALGKQLRTHGLDYEIEYIHEHMPDDELLSERQRDVLTDAVENGYYETPRSVTLQELAASFGLAKSTYGETLQRAEAAIIKQFIADQPPLDLE